MTAITALLVLTAGDALLEAIRFTTVLAALVAARWVPDAERRHPSTMDLCRQTRIVGIVRRVVAAKEPGPRAGEATR